MIAVAVVGWSSVLAQLGFRPGWDPPGILGALGEHLSQLGSVVAPSPTATPLATATPTGTPTLEPTPTPTATAEPTPTPEPTPSPEPTPTASSTARPTATLAPPTATPIPPTATPARSRPPALMRHVVGSGESVSSIAALYGVGAEAIISANRLPPGATVMPGQLLYVPLVRGIVHIVAPGETLAAIARLYGLTVDTLADINGLADPGVLVVGQPLLIPGVSLPAPAPLTPVPRPPVPTRAQVPALPTARAAPAPPAASVRPPPASGGRGLAIFLWPAQGGVSQRFGEDGHTGIDLMGGMGEPVFAAGAGVVAAVLQSDFGYGWRIEIDHGAGLSTLYGHLSQLFVRVGDRVAPGQRIGSVGSTGDSTGPHLHFEVRRAGIPVDPLPHLP